MTPRRFYLLQRRFYLEVDTAMAGVWRAKQEAEAGTPLPATYPARSALAAAGYTAAEDLVGVDEDELMRAGLSMTEAQGVLAALHLL